ncbi:ATP-binding cassette domain-containing protein [Psychrobacter sp. APC 3281]|uniref:ABC transporter ATP-binding protein n=1 Tax=Psychrobacter sp. APC 3281 TaxID=3035190 RepID=UPI0025B30BD2|nr:ATP-binding cassette domain-containing protein [Psychrobacter sp. APC 3281]MDN3447056.1 ATP-binding cassette domain-containing protein [Psychrobacter sp. APC 3281]
MSIDTGRVLLEFDNLWVHSQRTINAQSIKNSKEALKKPSMPSSIYQNWTSKLTANTSLDKEPSIHDRTLISGASGTLLSGQVTVLTGASGSGKSVLLRILAGLLPMSSGTVRLDDDTSSNVYHDIHETAPVLWRQQVALLAQHPQLLDGSVLENLQMPYQLYAHQSQTFNIDWHIVQLEHLDRSADFLQQDAKHLSGGERQLVNTLRLLQLSPKVLLLDEPTAALDIDTSAQLVNLLINWLHADAQRTLLWVTHDTKDIMPLANRHWHMQAGVLIADS